MEWAADSGFENIGIDLILGLPGYTRLHLQQDLEIVNHLPITHLSVYLLSIDSNTVFEKLMQKGRFQPQTDDELADQYLWVSDYLKSIGFEHLKFLISLKTLNIPYITPPIGNNRNMWALVRLHILSI